MLRERTLTTVKWDTPGQSVTGKLAIAREAEFDGKRNMAFTVVDPYDGHLFRFFGTTEINAKLFASDIGRMIRLTFIGADDLGGGKMHKHFRLELEDPDFKTAEAQSRPPEKAPALEITDDDIPFN